jgi:phenylacetate-CoA ligase
LRYLDRIKESFTSKLFFPFSSYLLNRRGISSNYRILIKSEWYPEERLREIQFKKMLRTLEFANSRVPYYMKIFKDIGFSPKDIKQLEDIRMLPPLSRQDVIDHHREMVDFCHYDSVRFADNSGRGAGEPIQLARFRKHKLVRNTSSGSTGMRTVFYEDGSITSSSWANEMRMKSWFGINPGSKEMRMARISTDFMLKNRTLLMRRYLWNQMVLPGINLSDNDYEICYESLRKFRPKVLWGITSALFGLAGYIQKNSKQFLGHCPDLVITWAAPLYEHERKTLMSVFGCPVTNLYGSREVGHVAAICPEGSFHINQETLLVETDDVEKVYGGDDVGEILVTTLETTPMPFIRYRMGDVGRVASSSSDCSCGRSLQVLKDFLGRTGEIFITRDGRMISPNFWCRTFMNDGIANAFKRFQVIYKKDGNIRIRLVRKNNNSHEAESLLKEFLKKNFHSDIKISLDYVEKIEHQISGKYQMVVNEARNNVSSS